MKSPVLFLVFNRPEKTKIVFEAIRKAKPPKLYIAADGARNDKKEEAGKCAEVKLIFKGIDWDCEVKTLYRDGNLGCKLAVSSAITWFFENEEEGVILEDDCLPGETFFQFMDELLETYRDDCRIGCINGFNVMANINRDQDSYFFTASPYIWGWGTWKRVWNLYDIQMKEWPEFRNNQQLEKIFGVNEVWKSKKKIFNNVWLGKINTWDYQFCFLIYLNELLCVQPYKNLIKNIGFDLEATHTLDITSEHATRAIEDINFPLIHPVEVKREYLIEKWELENNSKTKKMLRIFKRLINLKTINRNLYLIIRKLNK